MVERPEGGLESKVESNRDLLRIESGHSSSPGGTLSQTKVYVKERNFTTMDDERVVATTKVGSSVSDFRANTIFTEPLKSQVQNSMYSSQPGHSSLLKNQINTSKFTLRDSKHRV